MPKPKTIELTGLCKVSKGWILVVPPEIRDRTEQKAWMLAGGVIDMSDPFTRSIVAGQESRLEPAPAGAAVSTIRHPGIIGLRNAWEIRHGRRKAEQTKADAIAEKAGEAAAQAVDGGVQKPDEVRRQPPLRR
jgi:hypothetical protein